MNIVKNSSIMLAIGTCYVEFNWAIRDSYSGHIIMFLAPLAGHLQHGESVFLPEFCPHEKT